MRKLFTFRNTFILMLAAVAVAMAFVRYDKRRKDTIEREELRIARAVSDLPDGVEEAWLGYVDLQLAALIASRDGMIFLAKRFDEMTYISPNTPFKITCDPRLASIDFGSGEDAEHVYVYGILAEPANEAPPLPVHRSSIAAGKLFKAVCGRIASTMTKLIAETSAGRSLQ